MAHHPDRFWMVYSPQGGPPVRRMPTFHAARHAAILLATKHPAQDFYVLESRWGRKAGTITTPPEMVQVERTEDRSTWEAFEAAGLTP